ncbi:MAG: b-brl protein [Ignavibacteria bacterium]|nr:b-brl protein [Ignavibacteria bacterium]
MKKLFGIIIVATLLMIASHAFALQDEDEEHSKMQVNGHFVITYPLGGFGDYWSIGYGINLSLEYELFENILVGIESGYLYWEPNNIEQGKKESYYIIPAHFHAYYLFEKTTGFWPFAGFDAGMNFMGYSYTLGTENTKNSGNSIAIAPVFGFSVPFSGGLNMNVNARYNLVLEPMVEAFKGSSTNSGKISYLSLNIGLSYPF